MTVGESKQESLRERRVDSSDRRVLKTREKLIAAFRDRLDSGDVDTLTVTSIVRAAGVTRSSFYAHFSGVGHLAATALSDLSETIIADARATIRAGASKTTVNEQVIYEITRFISEHRRSYGALLIADPEFGAALAEGMVASTLVTLRTRETLAADPEVTARYLAAGMLAVITWWLTDDGDRTVEDLARALIAIAPPDFRD
ncbi:transcriptional regulator, TetR family [Nocardioides sp. YR527]|uniref:TetR/AcrR family transcriptional regulator n=1 Tax=Nocardioides sp. YR527 TaxID=1881028 RepID=UPI0008883F33|nr:TetR/AcrR family transcriptional regulator [Nocardioides sp. YR527]SDJ82559.1 transcriptional regulator, TetR family [Nocardioides sp. YR527]